MRRFEEGDRVRVDIPDQSDPDHERLHGVHGTIVEIIEDDAGQETGDQRDSHIFILETEEDYLAHLRWRDIRPAPEQ
jgi:ribosomal protein L21E